MEIFKKPPFALENSKKLERSRTQVGTDVLIRNRHPSQMLTAQGQFFKIHEGFGIASGTDLFEHSLQQQGVLGGGV